MTDAKAGNPLFRPTSLLLAALSLSIGWGIRGNFGHEAGAMVPGALTAIAVCLLSGRADWRQRVMYFGFFGALGWGFGGSISYMQVISYTHSGQYASQVYGFACLFLFGFLWAGMGGAGTALPAVWDRDRLTALFRPLMWIFGFWILLNLCTSWLENFGSATSRHEDPLYWFDADWLPALFALLGVLAFDFWDRRAEGAMFFVAASGIGIAVGAFIHLILWFTGLHKVFGNFITRRIAVEKGPWDRLIDCTAPFFNQTSTPFPDYSPAIVEQQFTIINWPHFMSGITDHFWPFLVLGAVIGLAIGAAVYFFLYGQFRAGSSLFLHLALGWLIGFLLLPTIIGLRVTPPRSDDWSGILGAFIAMIIYMYRYNWRQVAFAAVVSGIIGGLGFSGAAWLKLMVVRIGNPNLGGSSAWKHWQNANWHSFLEQSYGFINGIAVAVAIGLLVTRQPALLERGRMRRWTEVFAVVFVILGLTYLNLSKNPRAWIESGAVAATLPAPLIGKIEVPADGWAKGPLDAAARAFNWEAINKTAADESQRRVYTIAPKSHTWFALVYVALAVVAGFLLVRHLRNPLAVIPESTLGKGQLLYLVLLWAMVIGNFERALPSFDHQRLLTEWVIFINAVIATLLVVASPRKTEFVAQRPVRGFGRYLTAAVGVLVVVWAAAAMAQAASIHRIYDGKFAGHAGRNGQPQFRFGPDAEWRADPLRMGQDHS